MNTLEKLSEHAKRVPGYIRFPLLLGSFALAFYWMFTDSGASLWLIEIQADLFDGKFYIMLTGLLTMLICMIPTFFLINLLAYLFPKK